MPKQRTTKGKRSTVNTPKRGQQPTIQHDFPSAQTLCRINLFDRRTYETLKKVTIPAEIKPILQLRDRDRIEQVKQATTPAVLLDVVPQAIGLAETLWEDRMQQYGPEMLPLIVERLQQSRTIQDRDTQTRVVERLIAHLRWRGDAGADALLAAFDALDGYGRSLACVVLGLLKAQDATDQIWTYYQKVARDRQKSYFVGALWGLIDLQDERASGALAELLQSGQEFYERFGFLALAGDARSIAPLFHAIIHARPEEREDGVMAIAAIGHRIGREALRAEIARIMPATRPAEEADTWADQILARTPSDVEDYFSLYLRGPTPEDLAQATNI